MLENIQLFWDLFFFPLYSVFELGLFFDVVSGILLVYAVHKGLKEVLQCFS